MMSDVSPEVADCPFCDLSDQPTDMFDYNQPIGRGEISLMPDRGMMMPGYFLAVTKEHLTSFAQLDQLDIISEELTAQEEALARVYGGYFRVEHGSDNIDQCGSGGCIDHAHVHLIPDDEVAEYVRQQLPWQQLDSYEELAEFKGSPYIYLGRLGIHFVVPDPQLPGQWIRRQIAKVKGDEVWDWALRNSTAELFKTFLENGLFPYGRHLYDPSTKQFKSEPIRPGMKQPDDILPQPGRRAIYWKRGDHKSSFEAALAAGAFKDGTLFGRQDSNEEQDG